MCASALSLLRPTTQKPNISPVSDLSLWQTETSELRYRVALITNRWIAPVGVSRLACPNNILASREPVPLSSILSIPGSPSFMH